MTRRQGARLATLLREAILAFFAFGVWLSKTQQGESMQWRTACGESQWGPSQHRRPILVHSRLALCRGTPRLMR